MQIRDVAIKVDYETEPIIVPGLIYDEKLPLAITPFFYGHGIQDGQRKAITHIPTGCLFPHLYLDGHGDAEIALSFMQERTISDAIDWSFTDPTYVIADDDNAAKIRRLFQDLIVHLKQSKAKTAS